MTAEMGNTQKQHIPVRSSFTHHSSDWLSVFGALSVSVSVLVVSPTDPYPLVGETLELNCTMQETSHRTPNDVHQMRFKRSNGKPMTDSEVVILSNDKIQLRWHNLTEDDSGYVYCYMGPTLLHGADVTVGGEWTLSVCVKNNNEQCAKQL